jgi:hypothetical protein
MKLTGILRGQNDGHGIGIKLNKAVLPARRRGCSRNSAADMTAA